MTQEGDQTPLRQAPGGPFTSTQSNLEGVTTPLEMRIRPNLLRRRKQILSRGAWCPLLDAILGNAPGLPVCPGVSSRQFKGWSPASFLSWSLCFAIVGHSPYLLGMVARQFLGWSPGHSRECPTYLGWLPASSEVGRPVLA